MLWHSRHRYTVTWLRCVLRNTRACAVFAPHCGQCSPLGGQCVTNHPSLISSANRSTIGKSMLWTLSHQALLLDMSHGLFHVSQLPILRSALRNERTVSFKFQVPSFKADTHWRLLNLSLELKQ